MDTLVKKAYDNWMHVIEYDGNSLLSSKVHKGSGALGGDVNMGPPIYSNSFDHQLGLPSLPVVVPPEQPSMNQGLTVGGKNLIEHFFIIIIIIIFFGKPVPSPFFFTIKYLK